MSAGHYIGIYSVMFKLSIVYPKIPYVERRYLNENEKGIFQHRLSADAIRGETVIKHSQTYINGIPGYPSKTRGNSAPTCLAEKAFSDTLNRKYISRKYPNYD